MVLSYNSTKSTRFGAICPQFRPKIGYFSTLNPYFLQNWFFIAKFVILLIFRETFGSDGIPKASNHHQMHICWHCKQF